MPMDSRNVIEAFLGPLSTSQRAALVVSLSISILTGLVQRYVIRRALRDAHSLRGFSRWGWDIRMLRWSSYPASGQHLHTVIVRLYAVSMLATLVLFDLLLRWLVS